MQHLALAKHLSPMPVAEEARTTSGRAIGAGFVMVILHPS